MSCYNRLPNIQTPIVNYEQILLIMKSKKTFFKPSASKTVVVLLITLLAFSFPILNVAGQKSTSDKKGTTQVSEKGKAPVMTDGAYQVVDVMPEFPGGDEALLKYIADSTRYPKEAKEKGIQGKVIARFMIKKDGSVSNVSILKGANTLLDNEALRVVKTLPRFTPGKLKGKKVPVWFMIPISYTLK
jgi:TonB family protein